MTAFFIGSAWLFAVIVFTGHQDAVHASEAKLRAAFDRGEGSPEARILMQAAGYNVTVAPKRWWKQ